MKSSNGVDAARRFRYDEPRTPAGEKRRSFIIQERTTHMVTLRLARYGRKNRPSFRIVVQDKQRAPSSNVIETIGHYNPLTHPAGFAVKAERVQYWLGQGAQTSNSLHNLFVEHKIVSGEKRRVVHPKKQEGEAIAAAVPAETAPAEKPAA